MEFDLIFFLNSFLLGVGLAMDAFSVSIANGLHEPGMRRSRMRLIAGTYAGFQFLMPMIGWVCVRTVAERFKAFELVIPWIALILLSIIGGKMLMEGIQDLKQPKQDADQNDQASVHHTEAALTISALMLQGIATSIDALSTGFTIAEYGPPMAIVCGLIIAAVTYLICIVGLVFGKRFGEKLAEKASILGGVILIGIGLEIFIRGVFFK